MDLLFLMLVYSENFTIKVRQPTSSLGLLNLARYSRAKVPTRKTPSAQKLHSCQIIIDRREDTLVCQILDDFIFLLAKPHHGRT